MAIALSFGFVSCDTETNEEPGGTNVQKMAGRWNVQVDIVDESDDYDYDLQHCRQQHEPDVAG